MATVLTTDTPVEASKQHRRGPRTRWLLAAILLLGFVLRAWNLDWDRGTHLQPDERFWSDVAANVENPDEWRWSEVLDPEKSTLNPRVYKPTYVYGTMPLWASEAAAGVLMTDNMSWAVEMIDSVGINVVNDEPADAPVSSRLRFDTGFAVTIIGRLMSALIDTMTVGVVFLLARELTDDSKVGLLAALLQSLTVLHIQYSHFLGSEPWVAFFVTCAVWGSVRLARRRGGWRTRVFTAVAVGFAIASKLSGIASVVAPFAASMVVVGPYVSDLFKVRIPAGAVGRIGRLIEPYLAMFLLAIAAYRIAQPYDFSAGISLVFNDRFTQDLEYLSDINQGGNWPWVQPLVGRTPLIRPLQQMFLWGMGPGLGLAAIYGLFRASRRFLLGERYWAVPLGVIASYFVLVSLQFYAIVRYLQPSYPIITALSAAGLVAAWRGAGALAVDRARLARAIKVAVALSIGATVLWALAFVNGVYGNDNARLAAGDWMLENLPAESVVSQQAWDDGLPWGQPSDFGRVTLEPFSFGGDSPERIELLISGLDQVDYVIESSNKFYDSLPRTPARFPQMTRYYDTLFDGSLGFELVETFQNQPSLFGITIDDSSAEEAFTLYDHPTVFIWRKTDQFSVQRAFALLNPDRARTAINAEPKDAFANASMLLPDEYVTQQTGSSFSDVHSFDPSSPVAVLLWFALVQIVSLAVAPTLMRHAGRAAGAVYGLSKPLSLVVLSLPIWLLVSSGLFAMSRELVWITLSLIIGIAAWRAQSRRDEIRALFSTHRRTILAAEAVFIGVFLFVIWLRANNPDMWHPWRGGEKPMELAYLTAVTGSTSLPPFDPWLAGGTLNYYYMGWFVLAVPIRLIGLGPDVGFNLGVATYAALTAVTVFSTAAMLSELARRRSERPASPAATGVFAVVIFLVIGNLDGFRQLVMRLRNNLPLSEFDWWDPSRVNKNSAGFEVTEFPSFTVLFADLHPHFMAMPFFGLGLAGSIAFIERARQGRVLSTWVLAFGLGLGSGFIRMVHTWDMPTFVAFVVGAIVLGWTTSRGPALWRARSAAGQLLIAGAAHMAVTAPYRGRNQVADSGFGRSESVTNLDDWFAHWGLFLFLGVAYVANRIWKYREYLCINAPFATLGLAGAGVLGFVGLGATVGSVAALSFVSLVACLLLLFSEVSTARPSTPHVFVAACLALAFGVLVGVEAFTQNADIARLNTVFKFWLQVWHLFAIAGAFAASWLLGPLLAGKEVNAADIVAVNELPGHQRRGVATRGFAGGLVLLLLASLVYPVLSVSPRQANRIDTALGPSLDGDLWLEPGRYSFGIRDVDGNDSVIDPGQDRAIIEWLQTNVDGRPTIVEAVGGSEYQWWGRISIHAGLPTVLGWRWHQSQQRSLFDSEVNDRKREVAEFYSTESPAVIDSFLRAFDVSYVIVGSIERVVANPRTLELFAKNPSLRLVFGNEQLGIYVVDKVALAEAPRAGLPPIGAG
jgi:YYY domain-containing protein